MARIFLGTIIAVWVILVTRVAALELMVNYKFWDLTTNQLVYDYSGNSRHGLYLHVVHLVMIDRGVSSINWGSLPWVHIDSFSSQEYPEFALSYWALRISGSHDIRFAINQLYSPSIIYTLTGSSTVISFAGISSSNLGVLSGWNLFTIRFYPSPLDMTIKNIDLYSNLNYLTSFDGSPYTVTFLCLMISEMILYELWVNNGVSSISDLNYLIYNGCPTSPINFCLPLYDRSKNIHGEDCPANCLDNDLSCDTSLNCIVSSQSCFYGVYDRRSGDCLFYCPEDSCISSPTFDCSCKRGFKKITEKFVGCIPHYWKTFKKVVNIYVLDTLEEGYSLDSNGNCCVCEESYIAVSTNPLICLYMPNCLSYTQEGDVYTCSECSKGYQLNSGSQCLDCSEGYERISDDSIECVHEIERCIEYININDVSTCKKCQAGYRVSSSGLCDECQDGYLEILRENFVCLIEVYKCIEYDITSKDPKCSICEAGYILDSDFMCSQCESSYIQVSANPLECALKRDWCISYKIYEGDWVCDTCEEGYKLDYEMNCNLCSDGYVSQSAEILMCVINNESSTTISYSSDDQDQPINQEEDDNQEITQDKKERGEIIKSVNTATTSVVLAGISVYSAVSNDSTILVFYLNTIQLLSYLLDLNISLPFEIKQEQGSAKNFINKLNILSTIKLRDKNPRDYLAYIINDEKGFIPNMIYQLLILILLFILNAIFYCLERYTSGKLKNLAGRVLNLFTYTVYIQYMMLAYIGFADSALLKILNVKHI